MGVDKTNRKPRKFKKRKAKGKNARQDQRLKALEKTVFTALERKVKTWQNGGWNISSTPVVLNNSNTNQLELEQGTGTSDRLGSEISLLSQTVRFNLRIADGGDTFNQVRMLIVEPTDGNQTLALTDVLEYGTSPTYNIGMMLASPYKIKVNSDNKGYKVHYDRIFELNTSGNSRCVTETIPIKYGKHGKKIEFAALQTAEHPVNHNLHIFIFSDSQAALHPSFNVNIRSRFYDA